MLAHVRYMVIERFTDTAAVYARFAEKGRMLPAGLEYVDSWVVDSPAMDTCFQLMETDDVALFDEWFSHWSDLGSIEVVPVLSSGEAAARAAK
jgi:hypothetical protein